MMTSHLEARRGVEASPTEDSGPTCRAGLEDTTARGPRVDCRVKQMLVSRPW